MTKAKKAMVNEEIPHVEAEVMENQTSLIPIKAPETPVDLEKLSKRLDDATTYIRREVRTVAKSFCKIGFKLWEIKENKLYELQGYKNISEYGEKVLGFKKSSTANYIAICDRFSARKDGKPTATLCENYASFSYGQLSVMLSLPEDKVKDVTPDKTCREIRDMKKESSDSVLDEEGEGASVTEIRTPIELFSRVLTQDNLVLVIKVLRENVGKEISIYVEQ